MPGANHRAHTGGPLGFSRTEWSVALGAMVLALIITIPQYFYADGNPTVFLRVGSFGESHAFVEQDFPDAIHTGDYGHDGQQFYVLAAQLPDVNAAAPYVDHIRYRARRILFPLLASPAPRGPVLVWVMYGLNLLTIGAAALALIRIGRRIDASPLVGLAAGLNPAQIESLMGSLGDGLAFALALWGVAVWRRNTWVAVGLFSLAALSRETALVAPLACLVVASNLQRLKLVVPFVAYLAWMALIQLTVPEPSGAGGDTVLADATRAFTLPFVGWADVGLTTPEVLFGCVVVAASLATAWRLRRDLPELSVWLLVDMVVVVCSNVYVAGRLLNLARVAPLLFPAVALVLASPRLRTEGRAVVPRPAPGT